MEKSILVCSELLLKGGSSCIRTTIKRNAVISLEKVLKNGMVLRGSKLRGGDSVIFNILRSRVVGWSDRRKADRRANS